MNCRLCGSNILSLCYSFGDMYIADTYVTKREDKRDKFPYDVWACSECAHVQSFDVLDQRLLFGQDYTYKPGYSQSVRETFLSYVKEAVKCGYIGEGDKVVDVGSNDGLFLRCIKEVCNGVVLGIEPADGPRAFAEENGIPTIGDFLNKSSTAEAISRLNGRANVVTANNVFAHSDDLRGFALNISDLLEEGGYFLFEVSYLKKMLERDLIGAYFHEHLSHHSLSSLKRFLDGIGLILIDAFETPSQGGSVVGIAKKASNECSTERLESLLFSERESGLASDKVVGQVQSSFKRARESFERSIAEIDSDSNIGIFGAARSLATFERFYGFMDRVSAIYDDNTDKIGKFFPGTDVQVRSTSSINEDHPKVVIIGAWVPTDRIVKRLAKETSVEFALRLLDPVGIVNLGVLRK